MNHTQKAAFTLVELLIVIAIIAVMASLVISAFSNAAQDTRQVVANQQQAVVQEAVNSWVAQASSGTNSLAAARTQYNLSTTSLARLTLVRAYLDDGTYNHLTNNTTNADQVRSEAMSKAGRYLQITDWPTNSYPRVNQLP
jgi:prepilin-type N-terminal cleavage/methylation domain-containing protein